MTISSDDAKEALASVAATETQVQDHAMRESIGPGLITCGWVGLFEYGLPAIGKGHWFVVTIFNNHFYAIVFLVLVVLLPFFLLRPFWRPIRLKPHLSMPFVAFGPLLWMFYIFAFDVFFLPSHIGQADFTPPQLFSWLLAITLGAMFWLGRWHAFAALFIVLSIPVILALGTTQQLRYGCIAALSGFVLIPSGIWLMLERNQAFLSWRKRL